MLHYLIYVECAQRIYKTLTINYLFHHNVDWTYKMISVLFIPRNAMLARYMLSSSVRPSVRLTPVLYLYQTAKYRITQTTPYDSAGTLVFWR